MDISMKLPEDKILRVLKSAQNIALLAECISVEFQTDLVDTRFRQPAINQHSKRIRDSIEAIKIHLAGMVKNKDREFFSYDYAVEIHRVIDYFSNMSVEQVRDFMDRVEAINDDR